VWDLAGIVVGPGPTAGTPRHFGIGALGNAGGGAHRRGSIAQLTTSAATRLRPPLVGGVMDTQVITGKGSVRKAALRFVRWPQFSSPPLLFAWCSLFGVNGREFLS